MSAEQVERQTAEERRNAVVSFEVRVYSIVQRGCVLVLHHLDVSVCTLLKKKMLQNYSKVFTPQHYDLRRNEHYRTMCNGGNLFNSSSQNSLKSVFTWNKR